MTKQRSFSERAFALKREALGSSARGGAGGDSARVRRAGSSDLDTRLRVGDGLDIEDGRMVVPLGVGLEIDRRGRVATSAGLEIVIIKTTAETPNTGSYGSMSLAAVNSSVGSGGISVDITNKWVRLEPGNAYLFSAWVLFLRDMTGITSVVENLKVKLDRLDTITVPVDAARSVLYPETLFSVEPGTHERNHTTVTMESIVDLRKQSYPVAIQVMTQVTNSIGGTLTNQAHIKIERIG